MPQKPLSQVQGSQIFLKECSGKNAKVEEQASDYSAVCACGSLRGTCSLTGRCLLALGCEGDFRHFLFACVFL